jgi:hypothetical protein
MNEKKRRIINAVAASGFFGHPDKLSVTLSLAPAGEYRDLYANHFDRPVGARKSQLNVRLPKDWYETVYQNGLAVMRLHDRMVGGNYDAFVLHATADDAPDGCDAAWMLAWTLGRGDCRLGWAVRFGGRTWFSPVSKANAFEVACLNLAESLCCVEEAG